MSFGKPACSVVANVYGARVYTMGRNTFVLYMAPTFCARRLSERDQMIVHGCSYIGQIEKTNFHLAVT